MSPSLRILIAFTFCVGQASLGRAADAVILQRPWFQAVFHEYTHLLFRHNERFWPLWLKEGMAEIYATFELTGASGVRIGKPIDYHLRSLTERSLMPLKELFTVERDSPEYNESER